MTSPDYLTDNKGRLVPIDNVKPEDRLENDLVLKLISAARDLSHQLAAFKTLSLDEVDAFRALLDQEYGVKKGGTKGNIRLTTYDGSAHVEVAISDYIGFGPQLEQAKSLIDECLDAWADGADSNLRTLIFDAFQVNKAKRIDTHRVLGLRRLQITDDTGTWARAMEAISDAVRVHGSKTYVRFYDVSARGDREPIVLDLAKV